MEFELAKAIVQGAQINEFGNAEDISEEVGVEDEDDYYDTSAVSLYRGYSGRAMYGERTFGIVFDNFADLIEAVATAARENPDLNFASRYREDSLGRSTILY